MHNITNLMVISMIYGIIMLLADVKAAKNLHSEMVHVRIVPTVDPCFFFLLVFL